MPAKHETIVPSPRRDTGGSVRDRIARSLARHRTGGTIRGRIGRTLALPVAVILALLGVIASGEIDNYRAATQTDRAVTLDLAVLDLADGLQTERGLALALLGGKKDFRAQLAPARQSVDLRRVAVQELISDGGEVEDRVAAVVADLGGLTAVRAATDAGTGALPETATFYSAVIARLINIEFGLDRVDDSELRRNYATLSMFSIAKESAAQERVLLHSVFSAGRFGPGQFVQFVSAKSARDSAILAFNQYGNPAAVQAQNLVLGTPAGKQVVAMENAALAAADGRALKVNPDVYWEASGTVLDILLQAGQDMGGIAQDNAAKIKDEATRRLAVLAAILALCVGGAIFLAIVAARRLARPLAALAEEAGRIGAQSLPEAVSRDTRPSPVRVDPGASIEVRKVAEAFEQVQSTAYTLATSQARMRRATAESLANLGHRNQNLLRRLLGFITELEAEEASPTGLANLFELDHLATRMRRNAESLLVLVDAADPRQWTEPMPIADIIRAAVSEVEEYRRVTLRRVDDVLVNGSVVGTVVHMLAELIENGLVFSPPDVDVEVHGRIVDGGYLIAIIDSGVGMNLDEMRRANQRLRGEGDFIMAPARFLGHFVVGRLAAETGVQVQLAPSPVTGVTARVALPAALITAPTAPAATAPPPPLPAPPRTATTPLRPDTIEFVVVPDPPVTYAAPDEAGHTANGLRRRPPKKRSGSPAPHPVESRPRSAAVTDSPEAVRDRLSAFREGVLRAGSGS
ncbi:sensor histidine kinase [Actinoplanes subglobosus]|uniref:histidine kinase n=1 Tax=Actinoplanes subglobosus TaxID=1547892 RepID=A0ABV8IM81_9ACTN